MANISIAQRPISSPFGLIGTDENALSAALAWTFRCCPVLLRWFLQQVGITGIATREFLDAEIELQRYERRGSSSGLTDIEIRLDDDVHVVIEAKVGPAVPSLEQCRKYARRLRHSRAARKKLVALVQSADLTFTDKYAQSSSEMGELLSLVTWQQVFDECRRLAISKSTDSETRIWCRYLTDFLQQEYAMKSFSTEAWILAASTEPLWENGLSHWDIHQQYKLWWDYTEIHVRPLYLAFRAAGKLDRIWRVKQIEHDVLVGDFVPPLKKHGPLLATKPATIWHLDPSVPLQRTLKTGPGMYNRRVRCDLDLLLSCGTVQEIEETMRSRRG